jgi:hypothetical protein
MMKGGIRSSPSCVNTEEIISIHTPAWGVTAFDADTFATCGIFRITRKIHWLLSGIRLAIHKSPSPARQKISLASYRFFRKIRHNPPSGNFLKFFHGIFSKKTGKNF